MSSDALVVYVIRCEQGRFYVGSCGERRLDQRFAEHLAGTGCAFTAAFPPLEMVEVQPAVRGVYDEDVKVMDCMKVYGIDNVRGGTFSRMTLPVHQLQTIDERATASPAV